MNPGLYSIYILIRKLQLVGSIDFNIQLESFDRWAGQAQGLGAIAALTAYTLHLQGSGERIRVILQCDDPQHRRSLRVYQNYTAFHKTR